LVTLTENGCWHHLPSQEMALPKVHIKVNAVVGRHQTYLQTVTSYGWSWCFSWERISIGFDFWNVARFRLDFSCEFSNWESTYFSNLVIIFVSQRFSLKVFDFNFEYVFWSQCWLHTGLCVLGLSVGTGLISFVGLFSEDSRVKLDFIFW